MLVLLYMCFTTGKLVSTFPGFWETLTKRLCILLWVSTSAQTIRLMLWPKLNISGFKLYFPTCFPHFTVKKSHGFIEGSDQELYYDTELHSYVVRVAVFRLIRPSSR